MVVEHEWFIDISQLGSSGILATHDEINKVTPTLWEIFSLTLSSEANLVSHWDLHVTEGPVNLL